MLHAVAKTPSLHRPPLGIAVQRDQPIRQPRDVSGKRLACQTVDPDLTEPPPADSVRLEIDQRRRTHIERESLPAEIPRTPADTAMLLQKNSAHPRRRQPASRRQSRHP